MSTRDAFEKWTIEAPDGNVDHAPSLSAARHFLRALWDLPACPRLVRVCPGAYQCSPPAVGYPVKWIGPWLIYSRRGLVTLRDTLQPKLPFDTPSRAAVHEETDGRV